MTDRKCEINPVSSRVCEKGTKGCIIYHDSMTTEEKKIISQKEWEDDVKRRFLSAKIIGNLKPDGTIGVNLGSIADCFIEEFRKRLKYLQVEANK